MSETFPKLSRREIVAGASLLVLGGCGKLIGPDDVPGQMFVLAPDMPADAGARALPWQLAIAPPKRRQASRRTASR